MAYADIAAALADGWLLTTFTDPNGQGDVDRLEKVDSRTGKRWRASAAQATGATNVVAAANFENDRRTAAGIGSTLKTAGATGTGEYVV